MKTLLSVPPPAKTFGQTWRYYVRLGKFQAEAENGYATEKIDPNICAGPSYDTTPSVSENGMSVIGQPYLNLVLSWRADLSLDAALHPNGNNPIRNRFSRTAACRASDEQTFNNPRCQHCPAIFWPGY